MSGTRARQIRLDIASAMTGLTLDRIAGSTDKFRFLNQPRRPSSAAEREFRVVVGAQPVKGRHNTCDDFQTEFTIERFYSLAPGVEERIADDNERMWAPLESLQSRNAGIHYCDLAPLGVEETDSNYIVRDSLIVTYRLDSTLIT